MLEIDLSFNYVSKILFVDKAHYCQQENTQGNRIETRLPTNREIK